MITKPTLIIDEEKCKRNIEMMCCKAENSNLIFRPHFKTHQSLEVGRWFREFGVDRITVSSLEMAKYFSSEWDDITVAFPVNILEVETINELAGSIRLNLLLESKEAAEFLIQKLTNPVGVFIKIDVGYHRTGIAPDSKNEIDELLNVISESSNMEFTGFLGHAGHSYNCDSQKEILSIHDYSRKIMSKLKADYLESYPTLIVSLGDTPSCSIAEDFSGIDELRPGNFVYYDLAQKQIGSCAFDQIAVALACPIVAIHPERKEIIIYGGGVHFSKERMEDDEYGTIYGIVVNPNGENWDRPIPGMFVRSLSQEHGIVSVPEEIIPNYKIGDVLLILPVHSCMTVDAMKVK